MKIKFKNYNLTFLALILLVFSFTEANCQDGRIDSLTSGDNNMLYLLKNNISTKGNWSVEILKIVDIKTGERIEVSKSTVKVKRKGYENYFFDIKSNSVHQYTIDKDSRKKYYIQTDVYAQPKEGMKNYIKCLYNNVEYPLKAFNSGIEGITVMKLYISKKGCIDKVIPQTNIGYGLEDETKNAIKTCDCMLNPSKRGKKSVNTIWFIPLRACLKI